MSTSVWILKPETLFESQSLSVIVEQHIVVVVVGIVVVVIINFVYLLIHTQAKPCPSW